MNATISALRIHAHASGEGGIFANAYLVEPEQSVVAIDGTSTVTASRAFSARGRLAQTAARRSHYPHLADGGPTSTDAAKDELTPRMQGLRPDAGLAFLIAQSADGVAAESAGRTGAT
jgi:hypothetical protein